MAVLGLKKLSEKPHISLTVAFLLWKALLLILALLSPGPGYDTSTDLLFRLDTGHNDVDLYGGGLFQYFFKRLCLKLVRWDAIYFVSAAKHGYIYEQQWAFSWAFASLITATSKFLQVPGVHAEAVTAVFIASVAHLLSVLVLYRLVKLLIAASSKCDIIALLAASLHIVSPAGLFLTAPYAESPFSFLSFAAMLAYCKSDHRLARGQIRSLRHDAYLLLSGTLLGFAATVRSNALFAGSMYAFDLLVLSRRLLPFPGNLGDVRRALCLVLAGLFIVLGFAYPQTIAYKEYCYSVDMPAWCDSMPPSIYTYVQEHYWNNGLFRYWTLSNLPLFALGIPMLVIMVISSYSTLLTSNLAETIGLAAADTLRRLAFPQIIAAVVVLTCSHVQIITRLSSGYPLIYLWLALQLVEGKTAKTPKATKWLRGIVRWMVMYAMIQGGLFASFLPPA